MNRSSPANPPPHEIDRPLKKTYFLCLLFKIPPLFRKKKDIDVINDNDDAIAKMIAEMRIAAKGRKKNILEYIHIIFELLQSGRSLHSIPNTY